MVDATIGKKSAENGSTKDKEGAHGILRADPMHSLFRDSKKHEKETVELAEIRAEQPGPGFARRLDRCVTVSSQGDLLLDARDTLNQFMVNGQPNGALFRASASAAIQRVCGDRRRCTIRAYGEMVDLLWKDGISGAAIKLEMLWNHLANTRDFSLLCG